MASGHSPLLIIGEFIIAAICAVLAKIKGYTLAPSMPRKTNTALA